MGKFIIKVTATKTQKPVLGSIKLHVFLSQQDQEQHQTSFCPKVSDWYMR